ncbi:hypothetical protein [Gluconobacter morbifer]|uniref:Uncharacterized protein n=1 Tax=Gluconobacter morbifer G707 TaxID=1088869 RepID=G6XKI6_9PROT|nr:hypothetical protein [Gluconobacter morbifer]EHH67782.1 hypothetical protein GMO_20020 [Gluconobacter morbifer G707]
MTLKEDWKNTQHLAQSLGQVVRAMTLSAWMKVRESGKSAHDGK